MRPFVHLHGHTEYSLLDGISRIRDIVSRAKALNMPAVAITDHGNMYGAVHFYKEALSQGIKPIIGCEVYVTAGSRFEKPEGMRRERLRHLVLLAETNEGYANLVKIVSKASTEGYHYRPRADRDLLARHAKGLIALSACIEGEVPAKLIADDEEGARESVRWYIDTFGKENFFLEVQNHGLPEEAKALDGLVRLAEEFGVGLVATNDFHYVYRDDADAQDIKICISTGRKRADENRLRFANDEFYMKSGDEMADLFPHLPEAIDNTIRIAERCRATLDFDTYHLPKFDVPAGEPAHSYLRKLCEAEIPRLYGDMTDVLRERLDYELGIISTMGFEDYFLIVWDYVRYAKEHDIPVGPGRGSAAGSLVSYLLGITGIDPIKYDLLFERFLNPERVSMPDIDIDFCYEKRGLLIDYVTRKYGQERVAQIITFGTEAARAVIRDVGRVLDTPLPEVNRLVKLIPQELGITLTKALEGRELKEAYEADASVRELFDYGRKLEGIARNSSTHAAGVVISAEPLDEHVPIQNASEGGYVTQYGKKNIENLGLLKMDLLGLRTLTVMDYAERLIRQNRGIEIDPEAIPLDDEETCAMLTRGETVGVFQLESDGMTKLVSESRPEGFEDMIPLVALYRPGPLGSGMAEDFIKRKHGEKEVTYLHPLLEPILKDTFGVILYQEQVMQIASVMGGFSLGQADLLRRAMSDKNETEVKAQRGSFIEGARQSGIEANIANEVFDLMLFFAGYGFNKSHSAAYGYIAYQTAYLKAHYFPEFMAATMSSFMNNTDKLTYYINESKKHGTNVLGPDVNVSESGFVVQGDAIRFGLSAVKNVGEGTVAAVVRERQENGPFTSLADLCRRVDSKVINKSVLEGLIRSGAVDCFGLNRRQLLATYEQAQSLGAKLQKDDAQGAMSLFGDEERVEDMVPVPVLEDLSVEEKLKDEKSFTGFYITGHPLDAYVKDLESLTDIGVLRDNAEAYDGKRVIIGGLIVDKKDKMTKRNDRMTVLRVEDFTGAAEVVAFPNVYRKTAHFLAVDMVVRVSARVDADERGIQFIADDIEPIRENYEGVKSIVIEIDPAHDRPDVSETIGKILREAIGDTPVSFLMIANGQHIKAGPQYRFAPGADIKKKIEAILGPGSVKYRRS